jgi:type IV pilus assembly protein PilV
MLNPKNQSGVMLLEALLGVLLFSIGIIAMMGLQANALATVGDSRSRAEASFIAEQFISNIRQDAAYAKNNLLDFPTVTATGVSPYTLTANSESPSAVSAVNAPAKGSAPSVAQAYLTNSLVKNSVYRLTSSMSKFPGGYKPLVTVTPCLKTGWTGANGCPQPITDSVLGKELYGSVVSVELKWKLPTASATSEPRRFSTLAFVMLENVQ